MGEKLFRAWTIAMLDGYRFEVERERHRGSGPGDGDLNGRFPTKLDALGSLIGDLETRRRLLNASIARAKRMRRRALPSEARPHGR
jgi:hypothetical protein